jgi:hypothetical protein
VDEGVGLAGNRWTMPLLKLGEKRYYLGIFFKVKNKPEIITLGFEYLTNFIKQKRNSIFVNTLKTSLFMILLSRVAVLPILR